MTVLLYVRNFAYSHDCTLYSKTNTVFRKIHQIFSVAVYFSYLLIVGKPLLAQMYIFSVTTSADVERSFSKYNQLLTPQSIRLTAETLRMLEFSYWN